MKTCSTRITPVTNQVPRTEPAMVMGIEILQLMKTKFTIVKYLIVLCSMFAATAVFGQATGNASQTNFVWISPGVGDVATATNWTPTGVPNPARNGSSADFGDIMDFEGQTTGPVFATSNGGTQTGSSVGGTTAGLYIHLGASQVNRVTLYTTVANSASSGLRFNSMIFDAGSGGFTMGTGSTTNCLDTLWGTANPSGQGLTNNSANPAIINLDVRWRLGAGGAHTFTFGGTGDWYITNDIANVNGAASLVQKDGPGTMYWTAGHNAFWGTITTISTPLAISGGTLVLNSGGLFPATTTINNNGVALVLDAPVSSQAGGAQTIANPVNGTGNVQVNKGTLTLSGQNTYTGNTILNGGVLVANRAENLGVNGPLGVGGFISFNGGTLQFSSLNTFDYSPRFTNSAGQIFSFDTAGQNVLFTNGLASTGGTLNKLGSGTLTLAGANTYDGATTVSAGKLVIQGSQGSGNITVANSAALGAAQGGQQITPGTLTVGTTSSATLEFNNVNNTTTPAISAGTLVAGGTITVNVNSGTFGLSTSYPLLHWTSGTFTAASFALGTVTGAGGNLTVSGNTLFLNVTALASTWTGNVDAIWSATSGSLDWKANGTPSQWINGAPALFDDTIPSANTNVTLGSTVLPTGITVNNNTTLYSIASSAGNVIGGSTSLTKNGNSKLILSDDGVGLNTYSGVTTINGGTVSVATLASGGAPSDIGEASSAAASLVLNGGSLQYTGGGVTIDRLFTLGTAGGTIDDEGGGSLVLNNAGLVSLNGSGARTLTLTGNASDELDAKLGDNGGATGLTKSGAGTWTVTANNTNSGAVTITGGTLQVGNGGATGSVGSGIVTINPAGSVLAYNTSGTVTNGVVSGTGSVTVDGGATVVMPGNNSYSGGTTINSGSTLQVGVGGATGQLAPSGNIDVEGNLIFNTTGSFSYTGTGITGGGNLVVKGGGTIAALGANSYSGWTLIAPNSTFNPCQGNSGALASSVVTNNGTLLLIRQDNGVFIYPGPITGSGKVVVDANNFNAGDMTLSGNCDYTGGTFIGDNALIVGDGSGNGWITNNVTFMNSTQVPNDNARTLIFNRPDNVTFPGNIVTNFTSTQNNLGVVQQIGLGQLTLTGTNSYGSGTVISNGVLQVGNGGTSGTIGTGTATVWTTLLFNRSDKVTFSGGINGTGLVAQVGSGTLTLLSSNLAMTVTQFITNTDNTTFTNVVTNIYVGTITVSNGTLVANPSGGNINNNLEVDGGTLIAGAPNTVTTLNVSNNLSITSGTVVAALNKSQAVSNTTFAVTGTITRTGGSLLLTNAGPNLAVGDKFFIFNKAVAGGASMPIVSTGFTVNNNLAGDGSVTVATVTIVTPPTITATFSGGNVNLSWPAASTGLNLQVQTNTLATGLKSNWVTIPGTAAVNTFSAPVNTASNTAVFYRLSQ